LTTAESVERVFVVRVGIITAQYGAGVQQTVLEFFIVIVFVVVVDTIIY